MPLQGFTAMHAAAAAGHEEVVRHLLSLKPHTTTESGAGGAAEATTSDSPAADSAAASRAPVGVVLDLEAVTDQGNSALHLATLNGRKAVLDALVASNADVNARNKRAQVCSVFFFQAVE